MLKLNSKSVMMKGRRHLVKVNAEKREIQPRTILNSILSGIAAISIAIEPLSSAALAANAPPPAPAPPTILR